MGKRVGVLLLILGLRLWVGGMVSGKCESKAEVRLRGEVGEVLQKGSKYIIGLGAFRVEFEEYKTVEEGDRVEVTGSCRRRVIDFWQNQIWLEDPKIEKIKEGEKKGLRVGERLGKLREQIGVIYKRQLAVKEAGLVAGVVLGEKKLLDREFYQRLKETGTVHIVVASGYNVMILSVIVLRLLTYYVERKRAVWGAVVLSLAYAVMTGGQPPVVRAWLMGLAVLVGEAAGRLVKGWWIWFLAGWGMLMVKPDLLSSVSFQLSMAAVGGLLIVEPKLRDWVEGKGRERKRLWQKAVLRSELLPTISAQLMVAPLLVYYFGRVPVQGLWLNVLILPLIPWLMGLGAVQAGLGLIWAPLGRLAAWLVYGVAHLIVWLVGG